MTIPQGKPYVFKEEWQKLQEGIDKLLDFLESDMETPYNYLEYSKLYTGVFNVCNQEVDLGDLEGRATQLLYDHLHDWLKQYLRERVLPVLKSMQGDVLLVNAVKKWRNHKLVVRLLKRLFGSVVDRYYTSQNHGIESIENVGFRRYKEIVYGPIKEDMATVILEKIRQEREGETIDRSIIKDVVNMYVVMGLGHLDTYEKELESKLLFETINYYKGESAKFIAENTCPAYMKKVETRLEEEQDRCRSYLHRSTEKHLIEAVEYQLISEHRDRILETENSGFLVQMKNLKFDDLGRMYRLLKRINDLKPMSEMLRAYAREEGLSIINTHQEKEESIGKGYIEALLYLHQKYNDLICTKFQESKIFLDALTDAFTLVVNTELILKNDGDKEKKQSKIHTAELLSTYCDNNMKTAEKIGEENMDELLERIIRLLGYMSDKDLFQEYYRRQLSKRLLVSSMCNLDAERLMIAKLKMSCGASFTAKLEGMIKDKTLSKELQSEFEEFTKNEGKELSIDFTPKVLTTGIWPVFVLDQLTVSKEFQECITVFKDFYDSRTESRTLRWVHSLGTCQVLGRYEKGNKDLTVSTYQASVLLLFNQDDKWTPQNVAKTLTLPLDDVKKYLLLFSVNNNCKILNKSGDKRSLDDTDEFTVNAAFECKARRIRVLKKVMNISDQERSAINKTTQEDRKHAIEAAIVRIMKARKNLDHQNLILETSKQLMQHFHPDPRIIKRRVEDLITRDYLARDESNPGLYKYMA